MAAGDLGAQSEAERIARDAYGRLLATLAARTQDIASAEDALGDALEQALRHWPRTGVPRQPEAWVLTVARHRWLNRVRDEARRPLASPDALDVLESAIADVDPDALPDARLGLLFACAHPAIDAEVRTPLMLQAVLGLQAERIARAFGQSGATLAQRLVRAKRRIREARIPLDVPPPSRLAQRLPDVLEALYAAFAIDWDAPDVTAARDSLTHEALFLALLLASLLPDEPEVLAVASLICLSTSRREARRDARGRLVSLSEQDCARWDRALIARGEALLHRAHDCGRPGRFQIEAAIQSAHCARAISGRVDMAALLILHQALVTVAPGAGARVALAAVTGEVSGAQHGLASLADGDPSPFTHFQPYWATHAALSLRAGDIGMAQASFQRAIALTTDPATRLSLEARWQSGMALAPGK